MAELAKPTRRETGVEIAGVEALASQLADDARVKAYEIIGQRERAVAAEFDWAHSVDSASLAERLNRVAGEVKRSLPILLECNVSGEEEKYGLAASKFEADPAQWEALCAAVEAILARPHLQVRGLMADIVEGVY